MKIIYSTIFASFLFVSHVYAHIHSDMHHLKLDHLKEVNKNWDNFQKYLKDAQSTIHFENDIDRISFHLHQTIGMLRDIEHSCFDDKTIVKRIELLDQLKRYAQKKIFPVNIYHSKRQPYFIDHKGVHCAVGYLMKVSGYENLAKKISENENYAYLSEIKTPGVAQWAKTHGFTLNELALIQPGYQPDNNIYAVGNGTNGSVKKFIKMGSDMIFCGDFSQVNDQNCTSNIGFLNGNNQIQCYPYFIDGGIIRDARYISYGSNLGHYLCGSFNDFIGSELALENTAAWTWNYYKIPGINGGFNQNPAVLMGPARLSGSSSPVLSIVTRDQTSNILRDDLWIFNADSFRLRAQFFGGRVNTISDYDVKIVYGGVFDSVKVFDQNGLSTTHLANNLAIEDYSGSWSFPLDQVGIEIMASEVHGGFLYLGSKCSNAAPYNLCLSRLSTSNQVQELLDHQSFSASPEEFEISALESANANIYVGGYFHIEPFGIGTFGDDFGFYDPIYNTIGALAVLNGKVNSIKQQGNDLYIGGEFNMNGFSSDSLNYIAKYELSPNSIKNEMQAELTVFPNPSQQYLHLNSSNVLNSEYSIMDLEGKIIKKGILYKNQISIEHLSKGVYLLSVNESTPVRFVKL